VSRRSRLTVRARLTVLYTGLFAVCGAIVVAVSYILVARLEPQGQAQQAPASFVALCRSEQLRAHPNQRVLAKCDAYFRLQGAKHQRDRTLSRLLEYSLNRRAIPAATSCSIRSRSGGRTHGTLGGRMTRSSRDPATRACNRRRSTRTAPTARMNKAAMSSPRTSPAPGQRSSEAAQ
jgi:hypothetical protein